jgi:hypothetical protein
MTRSTSLLLSLHIRRLQEIFFHNKQHHLFFCGRQLNVVPQRLFPPSRNNMATSSSSNKNKNSNDLSLQLLLRPKHIPAPTWSIADLQLDSKQPPLPQEELDRLCRLALIDINNNTKSQEEKDSLNQDLANMLHMIQQVKSFNSSSSYSSSIDHTNVPMEDDNDDDPSCSSHIYDTVRGVTAAPLRRSNDPLAENDHEAKEVVWKSLLQPKTTRLGGGHYYFSIVTGETTTTTTTKKQDDDDGNKNTPSSSSY